MLMYNSKNAEFMKDFFDSVDSGKPSRALAEDFFYYFKKNVYGEILNEYSLHDVRENHLEEALSPFHKTLNNVSILHPNLPLDFITRKISLIADSSVFSHSGGEDGLRIGGQSFPGRGPTNHDWTVEYVNCNSVVELGDWLKKCKPLLTTGKVFYLPYIKMTRFEESWYNGEITQTNEHDLTKHHLSSLVEHSRVISRDLPTDVMKYSPDDIVNKHLIKRIATLDLPYIDDVDLDTFSKITIDEPEAAEAFRNMLRMKLIDLAKSEQSEFRDFESAKLSLEIREGVRELNSAVEKLKQKSAFQAVGATIATTTAILVAINPNAFGLIPGLIGTGGGIWTLVQTLENYISNKTAIDESPYYYVWLFSKHSQRT